LLNPFYNFKVNNGYSQPKPVFMDRREFVSAKKKNRFDQKRLTQRKLPVLFLALLPTMAHGLQMK
jgi:hypothetical protein